MRHIKQGGHESVNRAEMEARFSQIYEESWEDLLAYALRRVRTPEDAADLVAETLLVAWRRLGEVPPGESARLWLFGVARLVLANQRRGEHRRDRLAERLRLELATATRCEPAPEPPSAIVEALGHLDSRDREVLLLAGAEELKPKEIAAVLGISAVNARTRLHRARGRMKRALQESPRGSPPKPEWMPEEA